MPRGHGLLLRGLYNALRPLVTLRLSFKSHSMMVAIGLSFFFPGFHLDPSFTLENSRPREEHLSICMRTMQRSVLLV